MKRSTRNDDDDDAYAEVSVAADAEKHQKSNETLNWQRAAALARCESLLAESVPCWPCGNLVENLHGSVADAWADKPPKPKRKQKQ